MSGTGGIRAGTGLRIVRGAPGPEELAALVTALHALAAAGGARAEGSRSRPPGRAPWPGTLSALTSPPAAWSAAHPPAWR